MRTTVLYALDARFLGKRFTVFQLGHGITFFGPEISAFSFFRAQRDRGYCILETARILLYFTLRRGVDDHLE
jgi:hypothetical protein